jgi:hypothetical protein
MTIRQALKYKNKLVTKMNEEYSKASTYNSIEDGNDRPYDVKAALTNYLSLSNELIELKTKIHKANSVVYDKIFRLSELKSQISKLNHLNCTKGSINSRFGRIAGDEPTKVTAIIGVVERDEMVKTIETEIEKIQEELDAHNATTNI